MGKVLVEGSKVTCGAGVHQGVVSLKGAARLVVGGSKVLTTAGIAGASIGAGCTNPANAGGPCKKVDEMTGGAATCLQVDGQSVVLDSLQATTDLPSIVKVDPQGVNNELLTAE